LTHQPWAAGLFRVAAELEDLEMEPDNKELIKSVFAGESEMATRMRALDWSATPLGPVEQWPQALRTSVRIVLDSARAFEQERQPEIEKLRASEQRLAETSRLYLEQQQAATKLQIQVDLLQQLPVAAWTLNPDGTPDFVNRVWLEFAGQTLEFVRSNPEAWMNAVHPEDRDKVARAFWEGVSSGRGFVFETGVCALATGSIAGTFSRPCPCTMRKETSSNSSVRPPTSMNRSGWKSLSPSLTAPRQRFSATSATSSERR
jgi:PAS domain-containing protein